MVVVSSDAADDAVRLHVEIVRFSDPIEGRLVDCAGRVLAFRGWMQLSAALEATRGGGDVETRDDGGMR